MLTRLRIRNFKLLDDADIELGGSVVLIGPNNSGKTTALQALALWDVGLRAWRARRAGKESPDKRPGVTINRRDLTQAPVPSASLLWRNLVVRKGARSNGKQGTQNVRIDITVEGVSAGAAWSCGFEFDFSNEESFTCRPLRLPGQEAVKVQDAELSLIPDVAGTVRIAYLPPMSGLAATEAKIEPGRIRVLIGEGQTAQVIRNLCLQAYERDDAGSSWLDIVGRVHDLFGARLLTPEHSAERGEITMSYEDAHRTRLDLSAAGRGMLQTTLLLAYLHANPGTVLLLDEPDAHLEVLRQRQSFRMITDMAERQGSQIIAASHSEVVMSEAATRAKIVAFVGKPHVITDRGSQVRKALTDIGWDQYFQAEQVGWVLYVEGSTDLDVLDAFAETLGHGAAPLLKRPFVHHAGNLPEKAREHFFALREAKPDVTGIAIFDRTERALQAHPDLRELSWTRREIESYLCSEDVLLAWARQDDAETLFALADRSRRERAMAEAVGEIRDALLKLGKPDPWGVELKVTDEFLDPVFRSFFEKMGLPHELRKADYHFLARLVPREKIDPEVVEKLDAIVEIAGRATPTTK